MKGHIGIHDRNRWIMTT